MRIEYVTLLGEKRYLSVFSDDQANWQWCLRLPIDGMALEIEDSTEQYGTLDDARRSGIAAYHAWRTKNKIAGDDHNTVAAVI